MIPVSIILTAAAGQNILPWIIKNWLFLILIIIVFIILLFLLYILFRILKKKKVKAKVVKKLWKDLLLRQKLSNIAKGGERGYKAEADASKIRLTQIKETFSNGVLLSKKYKNKLKNISLYLLIGEPGSGKSELMRKAELDYLSNINDKNQGIGGTNTFHWWVTKKSAVIDVAGKIFFSRWGNTSDVEWRYFVKQLCKIKRKKHLINGIILTLPIDALIADKDTLLKEKALAISESLYTLQKHVHLCLPLYIVITKVDQLPGFIEFFKNLDNNQRKEIFGWNNNSDTVGKYDYKDIIKYFDKLKHSLEKYRASLLLSSSSTRFDKEYNRAHYNMPLFIFPQSLCSIKSKLISYLDTIFSPAQLTEQRELFLQGIYFTAATNTGEIYDSDFNNILKIDDDELKIKTQKHSIPPFFIPKIFSNKIFNEAQLVHYDRNIQHRKAIKYILFSFIALSIAVYFVIANTINYPSFTKISQKNTLLWNQYTKDITNDSILKSPLFSYDHSKKTFTINNTLKVTGEKNITRGEFIYNLMILTNTNIKTPFNYYLASAFAPGNIFLRNNLYAKTRSNIYNIALAEIVYSSLLTCARKKLIDYDEEWNNTCTKILSLLVKIEYVDELRVKHGQAAGVEPFDFTPAFDFLQPRMRELFIQYKASMYTDNYNIRYPDSYVFYLLYPNNSFSWKAVHDGVIKMCKSWQERKQGKKHLLYKLFKLNRLLTQYSYISKSLISYNNNLLNYESYTFPEFFKLYMNISSLLEIQNKNTEEINKINKSIPYNTQNYSFLAIKAKEDFLNYIHSSFQPLIDKLDLISDSSNIAKSDLLLKLKTTKQMAIQYAKELTDVVSNNLQANVNSLMKTLDKSGAYYYQNTGELYFTAYSTVVDKNIPNQNFLVLKNAIQKNRHAEIEANHRLNYMNKIFGKQKKYIDSIQFCRAFIRASKFINNQLFLSAGLDMIPNSNDFFYNKIKSIDKSSQLIPPEIPLSEFTGTFSYDEGYNPEALAYVLNIFSLIFQDLGIKKTKNILLFNNEEIQQKLLDKETILNSYLNSYINYWSKKQLSRLSSYQLLPWKKFIKIINTTSTEQINSSINIALNQAIKALTGIQNYNSALTNKAVDRKVKDNINLLEKKGNTISPSYSTFLSNWRNLSPNPNEAYKKLLTVKKKLVINDYLAVDQNIPWWNSFILNGINSLQMELQNKALTIIQHILNNMMKFPLCKSTDQKDILSKKEILEAYDFFLQNNVHIASPASSSSQNKDVPDKQFSAKQEDLYHILTTITLDFKKETQAQWLNKIMTLLKFLSSDTTWSLVIPNKIRLNTCPQIEGKKLDSLIPAYIKYRYCEFLYAGTQSHNKTYSETPDGSALKIPEPIGEISTQNLILNLYKFPGDKKPSFSINFDGPWAILRLFLQPNTVYDKKLKAYMVPISFTGKNDGRAYYFWFGISFSNEVISNKSWPTSKTWIKLPAKINLNNF
jgi:hypothetical protein